MRGRILVIALAAVAVAIAFTASKDDTKPPANQAARSATPPPGSVPVSFMYSPEKQALIAPLVRRFNAERHTSGGRPVFIDAKVVSSGEVESETARRRMRPVLWSPA